MLPQLLVRKKPWDGIAIHFAHTTKLGDLLDRMSAPLAILDKVRPLLLQSFLQASLALWSLRRLPVVHGDLVGDGLPLRNDLLDTCLNFRIGFLLTGSPSFSTVTFLSFEAAVGAAFGLDELPTWLWRGIRAVRVVKVQSLQLKAPLARLTRVDRSGMIVK